MSFIIIVIRFANFFFIFLSRYENIFPQNHCNILKMKVNIAKSIGYEEGFLQHELDTDDLKIKAKVYLLNLRTHLHYEVQNSLDVPEYYKCSWSSGTRTHKLEGLLDL